jgi:glycosyltransferase involved in cell wall biosynthesis
MGQQSLLLSLINAGLRPSTILSFRPEQSFPSGRRLWIGKEQISLSEGISINLLPFINITPLKQIMIGLGTLWALLLWGCRNRRAPHRVVYTFNVSVPSGFFTLLGARLTRSKVVAMIYDINVPGETVPFKFSWRLDFWLHKRLLPRFDGLVVIADSIIDDFAPRMPFICVEGGIKNELLYRSSSDIRTQKRDESLFVIVSAGGLKEANGVLELLEAFSLIRGDQYRLRIAGMGPLEHKVREAAEDDPRIEYCGYLSFDKVLALYDTADVLINMRPTKTLNTKYFFPSKLMEYLASRVPVITTCTGHVEEDYADFVFLLKEETPQELANMIEHVASLDPKVRADKGTRARNYVCTHKTWDVQGQRVVNFVLKEVLHVDNKLI